MDLQTLQGQLKTAIQNHQIVVSKMRNDPQNISLKKQLHDLQAEIMTLSEKQKQVVQQLRKELEKKQQVVIVSGSNQLPANQSSLLHSTLTQKSSQSIIVTQSAPVQTQPVALTNKQMTIVQSGSQTVRHIVPSVLSSLVTSPTSVSIKAPVATAVLFSHGAPTTNALLTARSSNQQRTQPVLVVPSPNARPNETSQTGVMLNLTPPIRVPQYPPPGSRSVLTVPTACHSVTTSTTTTTTTTSSSSHNISKKMPSSPHSVSKPASVHNKVVNKEKQIKTDFMSTLGLVTKDFLTELKSRKSERKRRTTANPQFSNAALEEKRKNAAFLNAENSQGPPVKRPRGRPRLAPPTPNSSRSLSPENNMSPVTSVSLPTPVSTVSVIASLTAVTTLASTSSTANSTTVAAATIAATTTTATATTTTVTTTTTATTTTTTTTSNSALYSSGGTNVVNGYHIPQQSLGQHPVETLQEHCTVCKQKGNLLKCSVCAGFFHSSCLQSPVLVALTGAWTCNKCSKPEIKSRATTWPSPLPVVHSYIALKAVKEEEKRKLLKRSLELKSERTQLQDRMQQLNEVIHDQTKRRTDLQATYQIMQKSIECLQDFITKIKQMS